MIFLILTEECESLFTKLKNKLKSFLKRKFKTEVAEFASDSGLEYPGTDPQLRSEIRKLWQNYYECLEEKWPLCVFFFLLDIGAINAAILVILRYNTSKYMVCRKCLKSLGMELIKKNMTARLECKACVSPAQLTTTDDVQWFFTTIPPRELTEVEYSEHIILSAEDKSLHIYNLQKENSGQYICELADTVMAPYYIEVVNETEPTMKVRPDAAQTTHSQSPQMISHNMEVFTNWQPWSPCSKCNAVGKRIRIGICTVRLKKQDEMEKNNISNENKYTDDLWNSEAGYVEKSTMINRQHSQTFERDKRSGELTMLILFRKGIPCRSVLLQSKVKAIPEVHKRKSEIMIGFCKYQNLLFQQEPCPGDVIFEVLDNKGKIVESANNSAGIFSTLQGIPPMRKIILRFHFRNLNTDIPIRWQIGTKHLNSILIQEQTNGRIYIDEKNHINLKRPRLADSNIYR
ncbi:hypothetical protein C0J52_02451 [Blattella germanica]|nr:hypothetical protein C0J52_02451 [Blattella germanica]